MGNLSVKDAQKRVLEQVRTKDAELVSLGCALGRVLAEDIRANRNQPPFDVSAMDGFALRSADLKQAPVVLMIVEDIKAGDMPKHALRPGQCSRIMTGAPIPQGADAVIRVEDTRALDDFRVEIVKAVSTGNDIRPLGEGMRDGQVVLTAGTEITPGVIGVLATVKCAQMKVYRRPSVAILATGDELEGLDEAFDPNKIPNSNSYALMAQAQALGIEPVLLGIARDDDGACNRPGHAGSEAKCVQPRPARWHGHDGPCAAEDRPHARDRTDPECILACVLDRDHGVALHPEPYIAKIH